MCPKMQFKGLGSGIEFQHRTHVFDLKLPVRIFGNNDQISVNGDDFVRPNLKGAYGFQTTVFFA